MKQLLSVGLIIFVIVSAFAAPHAVSAAPIITSVTPNVISNTTGATVVVSGAGFEPGAVVSLSGYGVLPTAYLGVSVLTADVPAGLAIGGYAITVVISDATSATLPNAITIVGPTATPAATAFARPLLVVQSYGASSPTVGPYENYDFELTFINAGQAIANNIVATFEAGDFTARSTGGVRALGALGASQTVRFFQPLTSGNVAGQLLATLKVLVTYTDANGTAYSETFTLTFDVYQPPSGASATATPTPTPTPRVVLRPQLVISAYRTDITPLQPGTRFTLELDVQNVGSAIAKRITLIAGGGSANNGGGGEGTPTGPGGVSGGGGDFTNFAPVDASNVQFLGDINSATTLTAKFTLIVNATTNPGAYPMKFSFVYTDEKGQSYSDDQAITLLVYRLPQVDVSFYVPTGPLFTNQMNPLPLQLVNLGRNPVALGNFKVTAPNQPGAQFSNNIITVGTLDLGYPFTLDAMVFPDLPGTLELLVTIDYTDDFNQLQVITRTLTLDVLEGFIEPPPDEGNGDPNGGLPPPAEETAWDVFVRFLFGFFGWDSGRATPVAPPMFEGPGLEGPGLEGPGPESLPPPKG